MNGRGCDSSHYVTSCKDGVLATSNRGLCPDELFTERGNKPINVGIRIHSITAKAALKFGSEAWVLRKREEQSLEAAQMKFLRHLLGITKLDKEKNQCIRGKNGSREHSKVNKTVPEKVATTRTEDGHK